MQCCIHLYYLIKTRTVCNCLQSEKDILIISLNYYIRCVWGYMDYIRDAIFPAFSRFPDFSSIQCEYEVNFSLFKIVIFTFESIPIPI